MKSVKFFQIPFFDKCQMNVVHVIFSLQKYEIPQISPQILRKATAKSVILGHKKKKGPQNPGGTG